MLDTGLNERSMRMPRRASFSVRKEKVVSISGSSDTGTRCAMRGRAMFRSVWMMREMRPICSWMVFSLHSASSPLTADSSILAWPWITPMGVPISWARPATSVAIEASCSASMARCVVRRSTTPWAS